MSYIKQRILSVGLLVFLIGFLPFRSSLGSSFLDNPEAMNEASQSIVLLSTFDEHHKPIATGSGFFIKDDMTIVTNYHVICDAISIVATDENNLTFDIPLLYTYDESTDIAILRLLFPSAYRPLVLSDSDVILRGEPVVAIGSPMGHKNTISTGIIGSTEDLFTSQTFLFTAPISSGSSGGALFNNQGHVIGITSGYYLDTQNLNYAVASNAISALLESPSKLATVAEHGKSYRAVNKLLPTPAPDVNYVKRYHNCSILLSMVDQYCNDANAYLALYDSVWGDLTDWTGDVVFKRLTSSQRALVHFPILDDKQVYYSPKQGVYHSVPWCYMVISFNDVVSETVANAIKAPLNCRPCDKCVNQAP